MRYSNIKQYDVANGVGIRTTLFVTGCYFNCKGCFNKEIQDFNSGKLWTNETQQQFIDMGLNNKITGYSILGGEPLSQDINMLNLVKQIKKQNNKSIWMWTGFLFENLNDFQKEIISYVDILVDGQFVEELKNLNLKFRGSSNQRLIDVKKSLQEGKVILWE